MMHKEEHYGVLYYYKRVDKNVDKKLYEPVSYENWKMLRELEPTKFTNDYEYYVKSKKEQYKKEVLRRKQVSLELLCFSFNISTEDSIRYTKRILKEIQENKFFEKWHDESIAKQLLNYNGKTV